MIHLPFVSQRITVQSRWTMMAALAPLLGPAAGCSSEGSPQGAAGTGGYAGSSTDTGSSGGGSAGTGGGPARDLPPEYQPAAVEGGPLLDASGSLAPCTVTRPPALLGSEPGVLLRTGAGVWFAYPSDTLTTNSSFAAHLAPLVDGALGPPTFSAPEERPVHDLNAAFDGERITLVWPHGRPEPASIYGRVSELVLAQADEQGASLAPPRTISASSVDQGAARLLPTPEGLVTLWVESPGANGSHRQARVAGLDPSGMLRGEVRVLYELDSYLLLEPLNLLGDRVVATYQEYEGYSSVLLDGEGHPLGDAIPIGEPHWSAILPRGERVLSAWRVDHELPATERSQRENGSNSRGTTLRLGWFDRDGTAIGASRDLQAPVPDEENVDPVWIDLGDDVGLLWSQGRVIYVCAGCEPNNHLQLVVLDGETLEPKTGVLRLDNPATAGGLIHPQIVQSGTDLVIAAEVGYHTRAESMTATVRCPP